MVARVVDQNIHAAEIIGRFLEQVITRIDIGYVHREDRNPCRVAQRFGDLLELLLVTCNQHEIGTRARKQARSRDTDAFGSARNNDSLVFEYHRESIRAGAAVGRGQLIALRVIVRSPGNP